MTQYEISNFAEPGLECKHNLCYWYGEDYAGYGPGAVGCVTIDGVSTRYTNLKHPDGYCKAVEAGTSIPFESEILSASTRNVERIMLGLRLNEGIPVGIADGSKIPALVDRGWVSADGERLKLTSEGRHFCSEVALELI